MAIKWGESIGRPAGSEYLKIHEDTGCVAAPEVLGMPGAQVPGGYDLRRADPVDVAEQPNPGLWGWNRANKGKYGWRLEDFAARCNAGEIHLDREWAEIYSVSSNLISTWRHKMRKRGLLTV